MCFSRKKIILFYYVEKRLIYCVSIIENFDQQNEQLFIQNILHSSHFFDLFVTHFRLETNLSRTNKKSVFESQKIFCLYQLIIHFVFCGFKFCF